MNREKITFTGTQETMLATLYARALDSLLPYSVLHDDTAAQVVRRIDYDFRKTGINRSTAVGVAIRAKQLDDWTAEFLTSQQKCTVLHLACGLDTRVHRLKPSSDVHWYDVDYPEVIQLRERLLLLPDADYHMIATSVTDGHWWEQIPKDQPIVVVFEGLSMYLHKEDGKRLIQRITDFFPSGQILFDSYGTIGIRLQKWVPAVRNAGATLHWGLDNPAEVEGWSPGLRCLDALRSVDMPHLDKLPLSARLGMRIMASIPRLRDVGHILRYQF